MDIMKVTNYINEEEMIEDLQQILGGMIKRLSYIFDGPPIKSAPGQPPENGPWLFNMNLAKFAGENFEEPEAIDISNIPVTRLMKDLRHYGIDGICPRHEHLDDFVMNGEDFIQSVRGAALVDINNDIGAGNGKCAEVFDRALARWLMDHGQGLTFSQVARLAGLDERTVRNAASKSGKGRLRTYSQDGKTLVRSETAYAWLSSKRGFVPTAIVDDKGSSDPMDITNVNGFMKFLHWKRESLGINVEDLVKAVGHCRLNEDKWSLMENEGAEPNLHIIPALASALGVEESWLTEIVLRVFYPRQFDVMKKSESTA